MMKVGITGGIGSGKSTVCRLFARVGVAVYDSDAGAKRLMTEADYTLVNILESDLEPAVAELHRIFSHEAHEH